MVDADTELVISVVESLRRREQISACVGQWIVGQQILRNGIDRRQLVVRVRISGELVDEGQHFARTGIDRLREIALPFKYRRYRRSVSLSLQVPKTLVIPEKEGFLSADRSPDGRAKLILFQRLNVLRKEVSGIEIVIPEKVVDASV